MLPVKRVIASAIFSWTEACASSRCRRSWSEWMLRASTVLSPAGGGRYVGLPSGRRRALPATPRSRPRAPSLVPIAPAVRALTIDRSSKDGARPTPLPANEPAPGERGSSGTSESRPPKRQVARAPPFGLGLGLVPRAGPAGPGAAPVVGPLGGPGESGRAQRPGQGPAGIIVDVGRKPQLAAGPQDAGEGGERVVGEEAALALPPLRPGIGVEQVDDIERRLGEARQERERVAVPEADVRQALALDRRQELRHAVDEGLAADEPRLRPGARLGGEMLAAAKADLEDDRRPVRKWSEQRLRLDRPGFGQAQARQERRDQVLLALAEGFSLAPAVEGAVRGLTRSAFPRRPLPQRERRYASADLSCGTRSVRSQEKPPSFCGARP